MTVALPADSTVSRLWAGYQWIAFHLPVVAAAARNLHLLHINQTRSVAFLTPHSISTKGLTLSLSQHQCLYSVCSHSSQICSDNWCEHRHKCPFDHFQTLHHFLICCTLIMPSQCTYELAVNFGDGADGGGTSLTHIKWNTLRLLCGTVLSTSLPLQVLWTASDWLTESCTTCCM